MSFVQRSNQFLLWAGLLAISGWAYVIWTGDEPLAGNNVWIASITGAPLMLTILVRVAYNLLVRVHSMLEKAGHIATWIGVILLVLTGAIFLQIGSAGSAVTYRMVYGFFLLLGIFLILLGDVLRHYESYQRGPRQP